MTIAITLILALLVQTPNDTASRREQLRWHRHALQNPQHGMASPEARTDPDTEIVLVFEGSRVRINARTAEWLYNRLSILEQPTEGEQRWLAALVAALGTRPPVAFKIAKGR